MIHSHSSNNGEIMIIKAGIIISNQVEVEVVIIINRIEVVEEVVAIIRTGMIINQEKEVVMSHEVVMNLEGVTEVAMSHVEDMSNEEAMSREVAIEVAITQATIQAEAEVVVATMTTKIRIITTNKMQINKTKVALVNNSHIITRDMLENCNKIQMKP